MKGFKMLMYINISSDLHEKIKSLVNENNLKYPSIAYFARIALFEKLQKEEGVVKDDVKLIEDYGF